MMTQRLKLFYGLLGAVIGLCIGTFLKSFNTMETITQCDLLSAANVQMKSPLQLINLTDEETPVNSQRTLVFVGVMTSKDFLESRAKSVYNTWGKSVPGRIAFFSSEGSAMDDLPVIALNGVDDRYPPQRKSFTMLHYMYEHYIDKFEWFLRADDDVFIKTDKLEKFLRRIDSTKAQFIGQAGRGNNEEFGLLSLEFDENFCMGGPGIILSRQTLKQVAPHIPTCLKNLYSTHEDVEVGRCVQKFAGTACTWNYEMQSIFHHNSSGNRAFSGSLKKKEVHSAITLHPIKRAPLMYRMYAYNLGLMATDLRQQSLYLHRDISQMISLLQIPKTNMLAHGVTLFSVNDSYNFLNDHDILGNYPNLNRHSNLYTDDEVNEILEWDFLAKSIYSASNANPKRKFEASIKEGLEDVIREIMENINVYSRQRGRVIEYREILYGYSRVNSMHGHDLILDLLLVYKKYRGKKMTVPVRKHLYIQRSFTETRFREITNDINSDISSQSNSSVLKFTDKMKSLFNEKLNKISDLYASEAKKLPSSDADKIVFILPLSGRYETFLRFLSNFEDVILRSSENVDLIVSLFINSTDPNISSIFQIIDYLNNKYHRQSIISIKLYGEFSRGVAINTAVQSSKISDNDIIFLIDVDIIFTSLTIKRIRQNTIRNKQIYLPIVFSEYNPEVVSLKRPPMPILNGGNNFLSNYRIMSKYYMFYANQTADFVNNESGYFREFGYGLVSIYKCDIMNSKINGFVTEIKGWGLEDVKFLERILIASYQVQNQYILSIAEGNVMKNISSHNLDIFRSADSSLWHIFHNIACDTNLEKNQYKMCLGTSASTLGNFRLLKEKYILQNDFMEFLSRIKEIVAN